MYDRVDFKVFLLASLFPNLDFVIMSWFEFSQEIADGVTKSAQAVQAAEAGIRQIGLIARKQTMSESITFIAVFNFNF